VLLELNNAPKQKTKILQAHELTWRNSEVPLCVVQVRVLGTSYRPASFILGSTVHSEIFVTRQGQPTNGSKT